MKLFLALLSGLILFPCSTTPNVSFARSEQPYLTTAYGVRLEESLETRAGEFTITAYSPREGCDDKDCIMASGLKVYEGAVACPRKIPLKTKLKIAGKTYTCEDRLAKKYDDRIDIFMWDYDEAKSWGVKKLSVEI